MPHSSLWLSHIFLLFLGCICEDYRVCAFACWRIKNMYINTWLIICYTTLNLETWKVCPACKVNQRSRSGPESFKNLAGIEGEKANELKLNPVSEKETWNVKEQFQENSLLRSLAFIEVLCRVHLRKPLKDSLEVTVCHFDYLQPLISICIHCILFFFLHIQIKLDY